MVPGDVSGDLISCDGHVWQQEPARSGECKHVHPQEVIDRNFKKFPSKNVPYEQALDTFLQYFLVVLMYTIMP
jgi:hypothetical protein